MAGLAHSTLSLRNYSSPSSMRRSPTFVQPSDIRARTSKAQLRRRLAVLHAPRDATVLEVADRPEGSVVREAEPLLRLVPADAPIIANIQIDTRDVERLHLGDPVTVKFEACPGSSSGSCTAC